MKTKTEHTPTPWKVYATNTGRFYSTIEIWDTNENALTEDSAKHIANAKFIERAVNSHKKLLSAVKKLSAWINNRPNGGDHELIDLADEAIALAEGK